MSNKIRLLDRAISETKEAYTWYESQSNGLGERFLTVLEKYQNSILSNPELYKKSYKNFREIYLNSFPFLLVYYWNKEKKEIIIISVFHCSRNPKKKYKI